ncbi:hypothetical protein, partial [Salmonella sp. s58408]|uniref:hypothetical protein n=1 Tax=Salmonella sp. s58408 TaxID=3159701 RepID=UPI003981685B
ATGLGKFLYAVGTKSKFNFGNYIFDDPNRGVTTRSREIEIVSNSCFVSKIEPKNVKEALTDEFWIIKSSHPFMFLNEKGRTNPGISMD